MLKKIGTLLPLTALKHPDHSLFTSAKKFIDWLSLSQQSYWQLLPLHPTPPSIRSPYSSYGIGLHDHLFSSTDSNLPSSNNLTPEWLTTHALYQALSLHFHTHNWTTWPPEIKTRTPKALKHYQKLLQDQITHHLNLQLHQHHTFSQLKIYATQKNINLIGDLPFYLPLHSPLTWHYQECFHILPTGELDYTSGVPQGRYFPRQAWNHPLYNWQTHTPQILQLFKIRLKYLSQLYQTIRLDHAIGFYTYGALHSQQSQPDQILTAPGDQIFIPIINSARKLNINLIAEDLSDFDMTQLRQTMHLHHIPGIRTFTLGINPHQNHIDPTNARVDQYPTTTYAYTSTHDTPTLLGYINSLNPTQKQLLTRQTQIPYHQNNQILAQLCRQALINSAAQVTIIPYQDWTNSLQQINYPGTNTPDNWNYTTTDF